MCAGIGQSFAGVEVSVSIATVIFRLYVPLGAQPEEKENGCQKLRLPAAEPVPCFRSRN